MDYIVPSIAYPRRPRANLCGEGKLKQQGKKSVKKQFDRRRGVLFVFSPSFLGDFSLSFLISPTPTSYPWKFLGNILKEWGRGGGWGLERMIFGLVVAHHSLSLPKRQTIQMVFSAL